LNPIPTIRFKSAVKTKLTIDASGDQATYLYKTPVNLDGAIFIGKDNGEMCIVYDTDKMTFIPLSSSPITTSIAAIDDVYYVGTKKGGIIRFE